MAESEVSAPRVRKTVQLYNANEFKVEKEVVVEQGSGITLGDYEFATKSLEGFTGSSDLVKGLHSILFGNPGKKLEAKKHIKLFNGFPVEKKQARLDKVIENKKKWTVGLLKDALGVFGLEKSGTREELASRLIDYLQEPTAIKSGAPSSVKKARNSVSGKKRKAGGKGDKKPKKKVAPSAFILFSTASRAELKAENPTATFAELAKLVSEKWKSISESDKAEWLEKAAEKKRALLAEGAAAEEEEEEENDEEDDEEDEANADEDAEDGGDDDGAVDDFEDEE